MKKIWIKIKELTHFRFKVYGYFKRIGEWIVKQYSKFLPK